MRVKKPVIAAAAGLFFLAACSPADNGGGLADNDTDDIDDDYPSEAIELLIPFEPGGGADFTGRTIAQHLEDELDSSISVVNQGGGGGQVGATEVANSSPDGYHLGLLSSTPMAVYPNMRETSYETDTFTPIVRAAVTRQVFQVQEDAEWEDFDEFMEYVRNNPGEVTYGTGGVGTTAHLAMELFQREAGVELNHVPYEGLGAAKTDVLGGNVDAAVGPVTDADEGRIRGLFSLSDEQGETPEEIPILIDKDIDASLNVVHYIVGPPDLSDAHRDFLEEALLTVLNDDETIEAFNASEIELSPADAESAAEELENDSEEMAELLPELDLSEE